MTFNNQEVTNPVHDFMNSDVQKRVYEMHTKGLEMVFDSIVGKQPSTPMEMIYKQLGWQGGTIHQVIARIKELQEREQILAEITDDHKNNTDPQDGGGNDPITGEISYKSMDHTEVTKRKRENIRKAINNVLHDYRYLNLNDADERDNLALAIIVEIYDSGQVN